MTRTRTGFALPAVLAVTGVVTIVFLVAITALAGLTAEANAARARARFLERALTAEAAITMMALTEPYDPRGIEVGGLRRVNDFLGQVPSQNSGLPRAIVAMDGTSYRVDLSGVPLLIGLRDQAGMINVAKLEAAALDRLGLEVGISGAERRDLWARLRDYTDDDDLTRPGGAESRDYGSDAVANRRLLTGPEWLSVLGVRQSINQRRWRAIRSEIAADNTEGTTNVNTASSKALQVWYGLTPEEAASVIVARGQAPIISITQVESIIGRSLALDPLGIYTYPSGRIIFTIRDTQSPWIYRGRFILSPGDPDQPFWIDQAELFEGPKRTRVDPGDATAFPYPTN